MAEFAAGHARAFHAKTYATVLFTKSILNLHQTFTGLDYTSDSQMNGGRDAHRNGG